jgi:hypothetical protein
MGWFTRSAPQSASSGPAITELNDAEWAWAAEPALAAGLIERVAQVRRS